MLKETVWQVMVMMVMLKMMTTTTKTDKESDHDDDDDSKLKHVWLFSKFRFTPCVEAHKSEAIDTFRCLHLYCSWRYYDVAESNGICGERSALVLIRRNPVYCLSPRGATLHVCYGSQWKQPKHCRNVSEISRRFKDVASQAQWPHFLGHLPVFVRLPTVAANK